MCLPKDCFDIISQKSEIQDRIRFQIALNQRHMSDEDKKIAAMRIAMKHRKKCSLSICMIKFFESNMKDPTIQDILNKNTTAKTMTTILEHIKNNTLDEATYLKTSTFSYDELVSIEKVIAEFATPNQFDMFMENSSFNTYFKNKHKLPFNTLSLLYNCILMCNFDLARYLMNEWDCSFKMSKVMLDQDLTFIKENLGTVPTCREFIWEHIPMTEDEVQHCIDKMADVMDTDGIARCTSMHKS